MTALPVMSVPERVTADFESAGFRIVLVPPSNALAICDLLFVQSRKK
jgi:hypothetical protein